MKAKDFVKKYYPKARSEKQITNGGETYYLIRNGIDTMYLTNGKTESKAWNKLKERLINLKMGLGEKTTISTYGRNFKKLKQQFPEANFGFEGKDVYFDIPLKQEDAKIFCEYKNIEIFEIDNESLK